MEAPRYDLIPTLSGFLDRHLILAMMETAEELKWYPSEQIQSARLGLLDQTLMVEYQEELLRNSGLPVPADMEERKETVKANLNNKLERVKPLLLILDQEKSCQELLSLKSMDLMIKHHEFESGIFDLLYDYAMEQFKSGNYKLTGGLLGHYLNIYSNDAERSEKDKILLATWGLLACSILDADFQSAADHIIKLNDLITASRLTHKQTLSQRAWLAHWSLFILFKGEQVAQPHKVLDFFLSETNYQTMLTACPHLLRYVAALLFLSKRAAPMVKDIVWLLKSGVHMYRDPLVDFVLALYDDLDFDEANRHLARCEAVVEADYFLESCQWELFAENARLHIFEVYCRVHQEIHISTIGEKLNMSPEEAELWIVRLIQSANLTDARIDSEKNRVIMEPGKGRSNIYEAVVEKTKNISFRSMLLMSTLNKVDSTAKGA